jgi:hypothetical protein
MPIISFENRNRNEAELVLTIQPWGQEYKVPHLAEAGIRYSLTDGAEDRCFTTVSENAVEFWCNADTYEIDIVHLSAFDRLCWDICVTAGWCGGIVDGKPTTVDDLLPKTGSIDARTFAELTMRADGWPDDAPFDENHLGFLQAKFVEHLGAECVDADDLRPKLSRPFGDAMS